MAESRDPVRKSEIDAAADGWSAHDSQQRRAWLRTTPRQRLAWLEDAKRFAARAEEAAARRQESDGSS